MSASTAPDPLRLDVIDDDTIHDGASNPLGGPGAGNGDFMAGETYTIDRAAPSVITPDAPDVPSLDDGDLRVTGPGGFDQPATFVGVTPTGDGAPRTATYHVTPPGGTWDAADRGDYTVALAASQVRDTLGNAAGAAALGTFTVDTSYQLFLPMVSK